MINKNSNGIQIFDLETRFNTHESQHQDRFDESCWRIHKDFFYYSIDHSINIISLNEKGDKYRRISVSNLRGVINASISTFDIEENILYAQFMDGWVRSFHLDNLKDIDDQSQDPNETNEFSKILAIKEIPFLSAIAPAEQHFGIDEYLKGEIHGKRLFKVGGSNLHIWDLEKNQKVAILPGTENHWIKSFYIHNHFTSIEYGSREGNYISTWVLNDIKNCASNFSPKLFEGMSDQKGDLRMMQIYDNKFFCAFNSNRLTNENVVVVWDFITFERIGQIKHKEKIDTFRFIDNKLLISSNSTQKVGSKEKELTIHNL